MITSDDKRTMRIDVSALGEQPTYVEIPDPEAMSRAEFDEFMRKLWDDDEDHFGIRARAEQHINQLMAIGAARFAARQREQRGVVILISIAFAIVVVAFTGVIVFTG